MTPAQPFMLQARRAVANFHWAKLVIVVLGLALHTSILVNVYMIWRGEKVLPYVITLKEGEVVSTVGIVPTVFDIEKYPAVVYSVLHFWLTAKRQLILDPVAYKRFWDMAEAYEVVRLTTRERLSKATQLDRISKGLATTVDILLLQPVAGTHGRTWEAEWREITTSPLGHPIAEDSGVWHATFMVSQLPPTPLKTPADYINAMRVFIEDFQPQKRSL